MAEKRPLTNVLKQVPKLRQEHNPMYAKLGCIVMHQKRRIGLFFPARAAELEQLSVPLHACTRVVQN